MSLGDMETIRWPLVMRAFEDLIKRLLAKEEWREKVMDEDPDMTDEGFEQLWAEFVKDGGRRWVQ